MRKRLVPRCISPLTAAAAVLLVVGCGAGAPESRAQTQTLWPTSADQVAVLLVGGTVVVTDGDRTEPLDVVLPDGGDLRAVALDDAHLGLLVAGAGGFVLRLSLTDGAVEQQACADCQGLAAVDGRLVSVLPDGLLVAFGPDLSPLPPVVLSDVEAPPDPDELREPGWEPSFTVLGQQSGEVVVGRLSPTGGARGGPTLVSRHDLAGRMLDEVAIDGRSESGQQDHTQGTLVVESWSSSGACSSGSYLDTLDGRAPAAQDADVLQDWSWSGDAVVVISLHNEMTAAGECDVQESTVDQRGIDGEELVSFVSPGLSQLRWLASCERALAVRPGEDGVDRLLTLEGSEVLDLGAVERIVWSPASSERCDVESAVSGFGPG